MSPTPERIAAILDALGVGVLAVDAFGRVELQNAEASRILDVSARVARSAALAAVLGETHPAVGLIGRALETGREVVARACELPARGLGAAPVVDLSASPIPTEDGFAGVVLTLHDRTSGLALEALFDQRTRSEVFARLAAGIAHEVRNPLGGIRGAAELLLGKLDDEALRRYPELIADEAERIRRLLDDLAELTAGGELQRRPVNVHRVLDDLLELQRHDAAWRTIELVREYDPSIPELEADPDRLAQVILNLVRNAVEAMAGAGRLVARTRFESRFQVADRDSAPLPVVWLEIEDSGPGIPEADLPHVFTPFFTRRTRGSGLGLAIAQHWTVRHGGRLELTSRPGEGTRVRVMLPLRSRA